jgi:hypothetical protein
MDSAGRRSAARELKPFQARQFNGSGDHRDVSSRFTSLHTPEDQEESMTTPAIMANQQEYRLALVGPNRRQLLAIAGGDSVRLPRVAIPAYTRFAEQLTRRIKEQWDFDSVVLDLLPDSSPSARCAVIEIRSSDRQIAGANFFSAEVDAIDPADFTKDERSVVDAILSGAGNQRGPFSRLGWLDDVFAWVEAILHGRRIKVTGRFRQLNSGPFFSLIRFETSGPAVWFKAVGEPNRREFPVSVALARLFPSYVPLLIATRPEWNAWLTLEAEGSALDENSEFNLWMRAATTLANLQVEACAKIDELLGAGCRDVRTSALLECIDPFFEVMEELMEHQRKVPPPILSRKTLRALSAQIKDACSTLRGLRSFDALGHLDFNLGNMLVSHDGCVFLDWAEAYVGDPLLTFEYFLEHFRRVHPGQLSMESKLRSSYIDCWRSIVSAEQLTESMAIAPLVAVFAYAAAGNTWKDVLRLQNANVAGYLRSLTRRMHREAAVLDGRRNDA